MTRDHTIKAIEAALEHDPDINLHRYPIHVVHDGGLRLSGTVADIRAKRRALRLAREAAGTDAILDDLYLDTGEARGEDELRQAVVTTLKQEPAFAEFVIVEGASAPEDVPAGIDRIAVAAAGPRVHLNGRVASLERRRLLEVLTWWVPGVGDVENAVRVAPPETDSDGELADAIRLVLEKDPSIPAHQIGIEARSHAIRLTGAVDNEERRRLAELDCWYVPGVHEVDNALSVKAP